MALRAVPGGVSAAGQSASRGGPADSAIRGRKIRITVPWPGSLSTVITPLLCCTIPYTVERPSPVPSPTGLVVKNGSKIMDWVARSIPMPVSLDAERDVIARRHPARAGILPSRHQEPAAGLDR